MERSSFQLNMMIKMASVSTISVFLLCLSVIESKDSPEACNLYATKGETFVIHLDKPKDSSDVLKWKFNDVTIFNRHRISEKLKFDENGSLTLPSPNAADEGSYKYEVFGKDGQRKGFKDYRLCVLDPLTTPTLKKDCTKQQVQLTCETAQKNVVFAWLQNNDVVPGEKGSSLRRPINKEHKFSCKVSNQFKSVTSNEVTGSCTSNPSGGSFPKELYGISIWIFVGGGAGIVLVLIIIVIICCIRAKRKRRMLLGDEEELRLGWTNPEQQHHHHNHPPLPDHHHHHQQQSAGHTGPRQNRSRQQRPRAPEPNNDRPQPSPRRAAQDLRPANNADDEQPPPLPQPRKKAQKV
ncbi:uncharacterized protein [Leuresthes tenuis]|uniref:uncharacterized protein n=1 Tax=Leuresthes tenuis TaxID=355514 RepID=UPI003B5007A5